MKVKTMLTQALQYAELFGFSVIPCGKDKRPLLNSWKQYQTEKASAGQTALWWKKWPNANIGIVTGKISNITVIDVDTYRGASATPFPETYTVKTGNGGSQLYYKYQEGLTISANAYPQFPHVDIRSDGGFVIAPPSVTDYLDKGVKKGGEYTVTKSCDFAPFPTHLFPQKKESRPLSSLMSVGSGNRNDSIASFIGKLLLASKEEEWATEVYPAVERANKTYNPPLGERELKTTFESIVKKEKKRRNSLVLSPIQREGSDEPTYIPIRKNSNGVPYKDMANVLIILSNHPFYKGTLRYNSFKQEIEYNGKALEEGDLMKIQYFMQTNGALPNISKEAVYSAIQHYANENQYDEARDWLESLVWDKTPRLSSWIHQTTNIPQDSYLEGVGAQWLTGMVQRILNPGSVFDYVLVFVGKQGIGKTSFFRIIGGKWYKSYTGAMDNKDFYLALRGAILVDLDEGAALYRSEAIKIKSIVTETHDEYRAPYDRVMKKYPRRFVFSMSTNDTEPFRDVTGNRRYWTIDGQDPVNFKWLEENREQLFAEACYYYKNKIKIPEVPLDKALENQETHLPDDSWTELISNEIRKSYEYCKGNLDYSISIMEIYTAIFSGENLSKVGKSQEVRIANILKKEMGLEKRRQLIDGQRIVRWFLSPQKAKELQDNNLIKERDEFKDF